MKKNELSNTQDGRLTALFDKVSAIIEQSRNLVYATANVAEVKARYEVGRYIFEDEQQGERAAYGKDLLRQLSKKLMEKFGDDWTYDTLRRCRLFYQSYAHPQIEATVLRKFQNTEKQEVDDSGNSIAQIRQPRFTLSWSHYLILMRVDNLDARSFYEIECAQQQWSVRQLSRQVGSSLYERLALSRNKDEVMRLACEGQTMEKPDDIIFDEQNFYVDLVFYNRLLQCYVLIDLKTGKLTHQDLGQMQMCVNYYDRYVKQEFEKPTIGILLCEGKNDALVELTLPKDANVYAAQYSLYLPDKTLLQAKLKEWIDEFNENNPEN